jgi:prolyl oligopeptidase
MPVLMEPPPYSPIEAVTETLHGVAITDPYRWLEDQESPRTRDWLAAQTLYARAYLDSIPCRERIRQRVRELLDVETYNSVQKVGNRYFFRKRLPGQEQPSIYMREGIHDRDQILVDPSGRGSGPYTAVKPLRVSPDGRVLLYEVKQGGERTGTFELLDVEKRETLPDSLPRGYLRGFAFTPDAKAFYYVQETLGVQAPHRHAAYKHTLGTSFAHDEEVFVAGEGKNFRLHIVAGKACLGFLVVRFGESIATDFYLWRFRGAHEPKAVIRNAPYHFGPVFIKDDRILAITDRDAPNLKIVEVRPVKDSDSEFLDVIPHSGSRIQSWIVGEKRIFVSYLQQLETVIDVFDLSGGRIASVPVGRSETARLVGTSEDGGELFLERESFTKPPEISIYRDAKSAVMVSARRKIPFDSEYFRHARISFPAKDGTEIPMFLVGRSEILEAGAHPTIMTSYGGYGVPMTPQFSVFVAFLIERGCLFALPSIRGGSEFGDEWHEAAKRRNRQVAFDDFIAAAEWLIETGRTEPGKLAIFGGSNSGLLVGAAMTQRPNLFRAVVCMVPMLDMLRYHLFDNAHVWKDEFGTAEDAEDFRALLKYSPYHKVSDGTAYPATMLVSGDSDQNCNPLHGRKMTARLQAANSSEHPIFLDYSRYRGHSPVLPLSERIEALTDRMAFLCDQLQLGDRN